MRLSCLVLQIAIVCWGCRPHADKPHADPHADPPREDKPRVAPPPVATMTCGKINGKAARTLRFPGQVKGSVVDSAQARARFVAPEQLEVSVGRPRVSRERLGLSALLRNRSAKPFTLVVSPLGGRFPHGGDSPFGLGFSAEATEVVKYSGKRYPPAPPRPMLIEIPAASCVQFDGQIDLGNYSYKGSPRVTLSWTFYYFRGDYPRGTVEVQLPRR